MLQVADNSPPCPPHTEAAVSNGHDWQILGPSLSNRKKLVCEVAPTHTFFAPSSLVLWFSLLNALVSILWISSSDRKKVQCKEWSCRGGSGVKSAACSARGSGFSSQHPHEVDYNHCNSTSRDSTPPLLVSVHICMHVVHIQTTTHTDKHKHIHAHTHTYTQ